MKDTKSQTDITKLENWLIENNISQKLKFSAPVTEAEIEKVERQLNLFLPTSYKTFIKKYGECVIPGELTGDGYMNDTIYLVPIN